MAIAGALIGGAIGAFGKKPNIPAYEPINLGQVQQGAISANLSSLPDAQKLGSAINLFHRSEAAKSLESATPGAGDILKKGTDQIAAFLRGEIPQDVSEEVSRKAAERATSGGFGGSNAAQSLTARDLGLTSLNLIQSGLSSAESWLSGAQQLMQPGGYFDVRSMLTSSGEALNLATQQQAFKYQRDLLAAQIKAAPDPATAALGAEVDRFFNTAAGAGMMAAAGCWVARECFGIRDTRWFLFRCWLFDDAPAWFRNFYVRFGQRIARWLRNKPTLKGIIKRWMLQRIAHKYGHTT